MGIGHFPVLLTRISDEKNKETRICNFDAPPGCFTKLSCGVLCFLCEQGQFSEISISEYIPLFDVALRLRGRANLEPADSGQASLRRPVSSET